MKIVVTGGAGFIGSNFLEVADPRLDIHCIIDSRTYASDFSRVNPKHKLIRNDIRLMPWEYFLTTNKVDAIVNFAAETHVDNSIDNASEFIESNYLGVCNILQGLLGLSKKGLKCPLLLQVSTDEVYGDMEIDSCYRTSEYDTLMPNNPYAATKAAADLMIQAWGRTHKVPYVICRAANNYGKNQHSEKLIPTIVRKALNGEPIPVYGDGKNVREWLYTKDFADGLCLVLEKYVVNPDAIVGEVFNFGASTSMQNIDLVHKILGLLGLSKNLVEFVTDRPGHDRKYALDWGKATSVLGWEPHTPFEDGLRETLAALRVQCDDPNKR